MFKEFNESEEYSYNEGMDNYDVVMIGNMLYRFGTNQIELEGYWKINNDSQKESFSYLFQNSNEKISCTIKKKDIVFNNKNEFEGCQVKDDNYTLNICASNIFEVMLLPNEDIIKGLLNFISGEYHGFFIYYEKTIEDRFILNFSLDDDQIKVTGKFNSLFLI